MQLSFYRQCYFFIFFFLTIDLYFSILAVIAQTFITTPELAMAIEIPTKEAKAEMETDPITAEKCLIQFKVTSCSSVHFRLFLQ